MPEKFNPDGLYKPHGLYYNAVESLPGEALVFSSGIIGCRLDGSLVKDPEEQMVQAWENVAAFLKGCDMTVDNLVRLTMHIPNRDHVPLSKGARIKVLGEHMHCAVTGMVTDLFDPDLVIEIDVVAARKPAI